MKSVPLNDSFYALCESIYNDWRAHQFKEDSSLQALFQMEFSPEPYFVLKDGSNPLYMLLTNPGSGMEFQHISNHKGSEYWKFASVLGDIYTSEGFKKEGGRAAYHRLKKSIEFSVIMGYRGVVNVETIPFHSVDLNKRKALRAIDSSGILQSYQSELKRFLSDKPVLIVSATGTKNSISKENISGSDWLMYQADLIGFSVDDLIMRELSTKDGKVTSAIFSSGSKHIVLMAGTNNLPSSERLSSIPFPRPAK